MTERADPATAVGAEHKATEVGSVFVSNYPPYSFWSRESVPEVVQTLAAPAPAETPLGLYVHVPFCRRRCKFCYFRVFTDKNSREIERYLDAVLRELEAYSRQPRIAGRRPRFVYFGGGTPSYISARHLKRLVARMRALLPWDDVLELTFECEPGTLTEAKLRAIREVGVTRLSLGVENFDDRILEENGRAHRSKEIGRVLPWIRALDFEQLNVDLIAGMIGETDRTWRETVARTVEIAPDSVTIYQLELPFNTVYSRSLLDGSELPVADWETKRAWHAYAIDELARNGYEVSSAYTMLRRDSGARFAYRDALWRGADLLGVGVSSFSHVGGVHFQNSASWEPYLSRVEAGELPIERAYPTSERERLTREVILQMKLGRLDRAYFEHKFRVDVVREFDAAFSRLADRGMLSVEADCVRLTRDGLLRVDVLLPELYAPEHRNARYT